MSKELLSLEPKAVWANFESLTQIPRPSKDEERIQQFMKNWGENLGLDTVIDEIGNVIIKKPATAGYEDRQGVILQGHLDMVSQKNSDTVHDFANDPIKAYIDGDWVTAEGTTLGADNGIGVAAAMSVLESKDIEHGPIEALFTCDEETGMTGAFNLQPDALEGQILMNLDSEDEGELYIGCAGGVNTTAYMKYQTKKVPSKSTAFEVVVKGLKGGHSGVDIPLQRGNANKVIFRFLHQASEKFGVKLSKIDGGSLRNAIPREAFAVITVKEKKSSGLQEFVSEFEKIVKAELDKTDPDFSISLVSHDLPEAIIDNKVAKKLYKAIRATPHGALRFLDDMPTVPETSTNLAIVKSRRGNISIKNLIRSSSDSAKKELQENMQCLFELAGASVEHDGEYPGWKPKFDSPILATMLKGYEKQFGVTPEIKIIHAGLECGLLGGIYPNWDMISFGPTIRFPHSPDEKIEIKTVQKFWDFLVESLKGVPLK